jgi:hypothetical protein
MSALPPNAPPSPHSTPSRGGRWIALVLFVAIVSHALVYFVFHSKPSNDEKEYLALGIGLSEHGVLRLPTGEYAKRMPLYPAMIALLDRWQGRESLESAVVETQTLFSIVSTLLIALIAGRLSNARGALIAGLIAALYSPYRYLQSVLLCETLVISLLLAALYLYIRSLETVLETRRIAMLSCASASLGLALLTRSDAVVFALPFALHAISRAGPPARRAMSAGILLSGVTLAALGWGCRNSRDVGAWTLATTGGLNFYLGNNPDYAQHPGMDKSDYEAFDRLRRDEGLSELEADTRLYAKGRAFVAGHPTETAVNALRKIRVWLSSSVTWSAPGSLLIIAWMLATTTRLSPNRNALFIFAVAISILWLAALWQTKRPWTNPTIVVPLGLLGLLRYEDRLKIRWLLAGLFAAQLAVAIVFIPLERLRWTVDGLLIITLAAGIARLCDYLESRSVDSEPQSPRAGVKAPNGASSWSGPSRT